jgi:hypothetical protein
MACYYNTNYADDDEGVLIPDWEILARVLSYVRQRITLTVNYTVQRGG